MKDKNLHIIQKTGANVCRFLLAASFIFSGFVKAVDPLGFQYKIQDYLTAFGVISWFPSFFPLLGGIILSAIEFSIGIFLFFGIKKTISTTLALVLMIFMTPLTLYLAIFDPVSDCGCFGDAWVLTNWETFAKNIVLLLAAIVTFQWRKMLIRFVTRKMEWLISLYTIFFVFTLSFYCLDRLPVLDFRPYKIGKNILEGMTMPEGAKPSVYESIFILEKNGEKKEFTLDNYPDSTWTFVDTRTILKEKGYEVVNYGTDSNESCDYPVYGEKVGEAVAHGDVDLGILICGTGVGISLAANKVEGIRAVVCSEPYTAKLSRQHNNTNILAFGARVIGIETAKMIVDEWLNAEFMGGKHERRVNMLMDIEKRKIHGDK